MFEDAQKKWPEIEGKYDVRITKLEKLKTDAAEKLTTTDDKLGALRT